MVNYVSILSVLLMISMLLFNIWAEAYHLKLICFWYGYGPSVRSRFLDIGQVLFFACLWAEMESRSINSQKRKRPISIHLDWTSMVNKRIYYMVAPRAGKMTQIARCDWLPERARWSHLARSGLPAISRKQNYPESHIINPLLTKFARSRWLGIGLVLFLRVLWTSTSSRSINTQKKNSANIQPSWPHTWSITHMPFREIFHAGHSGWSWLGKIAPSCPLG